MKTLVALFLTLLTLQAQASDLNTLVGKLEGFFPYGRHGSEVVTVAPTVEMIQEYIELNYGELDGHRFVENSSEFFMDEQIAGTTTLQAVLAEAEYGYKEWGLGYLNDDFSDLPTVLQTIKDIAQIPGVVLGFDGFEQNGCAAPTAYLLIIDTATGAIFGIDLNPCSES